LFAASAKILSLEHSNSKLQAALAETVRACVPPSPHIVSAHPSRLHVRVQYVELEAVRRQLANERQHNGELLEQIATLERNTATLGEIIAVQSDDDDKKRKARCCLLDARMCAGRARMSDWTAASG